MPLLLDIIALIGIATTSMEQLFMVALTTRILLLHVDGFAPSW